MTSSDIQAAGHNPFSLADLVVGEIYTQIGGRAVLFDRVKGVTITPARSLQYLEAKSQEKLLVDSRSETNISLIIHGCLDIKFSFQFHLDDEEAGKGALFCDVYYDNTSDQLAIYSKSNHGIRIRASNKEHTWELLPRKSQLLGLGTYEMSFRGLHVLDLRVLPRANILESIRRMPDLSAPRKRALSEGEDTEPPSQQIPKSSHNVDTSLVAISCNKILSLPVTSNPMIDLAVQGALSIRGVLEYNLYKRKVLSIQRNSEVYAGRHSSFGDQEIAIKVLKRPMSADNGNSLRMEAEAWLQEFTIHSKLNHVCALNLRSR